VIVVARQQHQLAPGERPAEVFEHRPRRRERLMRRAVAQLEHVPEQDQAVDARERVDQRRALGRAAQDVGPRAAAQVEVRDEECALVRQPREPAWEA
jgi:hypothetical protein